MHELAELGSPLLVRTALAVIVGLLLLATCFKWLRLRSPDGEHCAWLLLIVQGAMFASLTMYSPADWLRLADPPAVQVPPGQVPVDAAPESSRPAPKAVPLRLEVPARPLDRRRMPVLASVGPQPAVCGLEHHSISMASP